MTQEITTYNNQTGEMVTPSTNVGEIVQSTPDYNIIKLPDGTFKKEMKYDEFFTRVPETTEEKVTLFKVFNEETNENVTEMKKIENEEITVDHVFIRPITSFDEKTGETENKVITIIQSGEEYFVTSSKAVYWTLQNIFEVFGSPKQPTYVPVTVKVVGKQLENGRQINIVLTGVKEG